MSGSGQGTPSRRLWVKRKTRDMHYAGVIALTVLATLMLVAVGVVLWWERQPFHVRGWTVSDADGSLVFVFNHPKPFIDTLMVDRILPRLPGLSRRLNIIILDYYGPPLAIYSALLGRRNKAIGISGGTVAKAVALLHSGENVAIFLEWFKCLRTGAAAILKESRGACYTGALTNGFPSSSFCMDLRPFPYSPTEELSAALRRQMCESPVCESREKDDCAMCPDRIRPVGLWGRGEEGKTEKKGWQDAEGARGYNQATAGARDPFFIQNARIALYRACKTPKMPPNRLRWRCAATVGRASDSPLLRSNLPAASHGAPAGSSMAAAPTSVIAFSTARSTAACSSSVAQSLLYVAAVMQCDSASPAVPLMSKCERPPGDFRGVVSFPSTRRLAGAHGPQ